MCHSVVAPIVSSFFTMDLNSDKLIQILIFKMVEVIEFVELAKNFIDWS